VDWQFDRYNRFRFGGDLVSGNVNWVGVNVRSQIFQDAYSESPSATASTARTGSTWANVVLELGLRWDYFDTGALAAGDPGPHLHRSGLRSENPDALLIPVESHSAWSRGCGCRSR